jgi:hypothetical protein
VFSPESSLSAKSFSLKPPALPGLNPPTDHSNPFSGIKRAGQAKRAQNFEKFQQQKDNKSFGGSQAQSQGSGFGSQAGSTKPEKFS